MSIAILAITIINLVILRETAAKVRELKITLDEIKNEMNKPKAI